MTLQASGAISLSQVNTQLGLSATAQIGLNSAGVRTLFGKPSGVISMSDGYGKPSGFTFTPIISGNTQNYNLKAAAIAAGWNQVTPLNATVTINPGVIVSSSSTSIAAFDTGVTFPIGTVITLNIGSGALIVGKGGNGSSITISSSVASTAGGPALRAQQALRINNAGAIGGGGGGGGKGQDYTWFDEMSQNYYGSSGGLGGGGAGYGIGGIGVVGYANGDPGSLTTGGNGGVADGAGGGNGGAGGSLGAAGANGTNINAGSEVGTGAAGGAAVVGNGNITWLATGTRLGTLG